MLVGCGSRLFEVAVDASNSRAGHQSLPPPERAAGLRTLRESFLCSE